MCEVLVPVSLLDCLEDTDRIFFENYMLSIQRLKSSFGYFLWLQRLIYA